METQMTIRLPQSLSYKVRSKAKRLGLKKSDVVRLALVNFLETPEESGSPYESIKHLVGSVHTGIVDLGENHRDHLIQKMRRRA
ncbi:MAG: hypothetical protein HY073_03020 [Deltaproteobacteria bacterium]|nr:hypothetical protein [Deltaproteobacteria bacterium]